MIGSAGAGASESPGRRKHGTLFALIAVLLALAAGEIALRVLADYNSRFNILVGANKEWDPYLRVRLIPNSRSGGMAINSRGILGPEFDTRKAPGSYRIVVLGDSCSFVPEKRPFPRVLEERLRAAHPDRRIDVINASCPGYDSGQARRWYEREIDADDHDLLVVYLGWNDMGQYNPDGLAYKLDEVGYLKKPGILQSAIIHCYLLRSFYVLQGYWQRSRPFSAAPLSPEEARRYGAFYPAHFKANLSAIVRLAQSRGRLVRLMNFAGLVTEAPTPAEQARMHFPRGMGRSLQKYLAVKRAYESALEKVAAATHTPIIDIESVFDDPAKRRVFTDSMHFTPEGSEIIGRTVAAAIDADIR